MSGPPEIPMPSLALADNPRGAGLLAVCIVLMIIATFAVGLRLWARKFKRVNFAADDYVTIFALLALYGNGISECFAVTLGGRGLHQDKLPMELLEINFKTLFVAQLAWTFSTSAIKVSLLLLYARVFPSKNFRIVTYTLMGVVVAYCIGCLAFFLANCQPFQANFTPWMEGAHCGNNQAGWLGTGVANIVTDIAILSLPMRNVWNLQMPNRTKWAVSAVFGIGFITVVISIIRLVTLLQIDLHDFTYSAIPADILSAFEPTLMIACTCIPIMRPLFKKFFPTNSRSDRYARDNAYVLSGNHMKNSDHGMSGMKKGPTIKHKRISVPPVDGFRRLDDDERGLKTVDSDQSFAESSRSKTPSPPAQPRQKQGIEVKTDIFVQRE